jgi:glycosyltransferase involved in cell wall biosynthesis
MGELLMFLQAPINSLGYGQVGFNIAKQLAEKLGDNLTIFPIGQPEPELYEELAQFDWRNKDENLKWSQPCLKIWHQNGLHESVGRGEKVGFPIFELNKFTPEEKRSMKSCHQLVVCSEWAKNIVEDELGTTPKVIPLGIDRSIFNENNNVRRKPTIFFNCGKWEIRKGHDIIRQCFDKAFSKEDNVELWMMCENPFLGEKNNDWINYYKSSSIANKIRFIPRQKYHRDVYNIMRQVDVGVFPVRAEGWNLELLELLSCGKHVITTDYSGHTEFTNRNNSYIVETDKLVSAQDGIWFYGQGEWAELGKRQEDQIVNHMRETHRLKQDSELELNLAGIETAIKFSWENTAREILNGI